LTEEDINKTRGILCDANTATTTTTTIKEDQLNKGTFGYYAATARYREKVKEQSKDRIKRDC
jgi:hypothetical protein